MNYLPARTSRETRRNGICYKSGADPDDGDEPADKRTEQQLLDKIQKRMAKNLEGYATKDEIDSINKSMPEGLKDLPITELREMADKEKGVMAMVTRQGLEITRMKALVDAQPKDNSVRTQIREWMDTNKDAIEGIAKGQKRDLGGLELNLNLRTNNPMLPANTLGGSAFLPKPELVPGLNDILRQEPTFWNWIRKGTTGSAVLYWVNKKNPLGAAAFIAPGVYKPNISFTIATELSNAKKIAANEKMAIELLQDIDGFQTWVEDELYYQVMIKMSSALQTGIASSTEINGVRTLSVPFAFAALGLKTTNPNNWDVILSGVAQLRKAFFVGRIVALVNPIDYANMKMTKAVTQGQIFLPPATGATIIEDNEVPVGYVNIIAVDYYKFLIYKGFTMEWGLENDDFTKNLRTVIGEMRVHQYVSENNAGFSLYDTFAAGILALT